MRYLRSVSVHNFFRDHDLKKKSTVNFSGTEFFQNFIKLILEKVEKYYVKKVVHDLVHPK